MIRLDRKPFCLSTDKQSWVRETVATMTLDEKIGQILCPVLSSLDDKTIQYYTQTLCVGSVMIRPYDIDGLQDGINLLQRSSRIPLLVAANLENGGCGAITQGTLFANPLGCTATNDKQSGYRLGKVSCSEAASVGVNWAFAPIVDIDYNYHNPITNVRTFGSNPQTVLDFAKEYIRAANEEKVACTIKHFPGDGVDERDQHLLTSVNDLTFDKWMETYGHVYKMLIDDGVQSVMVGHIAAPNVAMELEPDITESQALMPASQSATLLKLLRNTLAFNGVVITDSTLMVGYMQHLPRRVALPMSIQCGVDVILFNRSIEEDFAYLRDAVKQGLLTMDRLDEAVTRVLALKAALGLDEQREFTSKCDEIINNSAFVDWTKQCADNAVTLVKDNKHLLPLTPQKYKRVYLNVIENVVANDTPLGLDIKTRLENEGFEVALRRRKYPFDPSDLTLENITPEVNDALKEIMCGTDEFVGKYDIAMIVLDIKTASNATVVRVNWNVMFGMGNDLPWYAGEMPLLVVSLCNPYHLLDVPMASAYINAYTDNSATLDAVFDKIVGRSEFNGVSPVDPFCGKTDTRL